MSAVNRNYGWVIVAAGALITCVGDGRDVRAARLSAADHRRDTGWSRAGISGAMTVWISSSWASPAFGWGTLSDRIGARPVVLTGAVLLGTGLMLASRATDLCVFRSPMAAGRRLPAGAFFAPIIAATVGWFEKHRSLAVSLVSAGLASRRW